jgi:transcriptional regulator with XRE-family HTH domain
MYERIKELCKNRGITLKELETAVGVGNRTIYRWDQNSPSIEKVCAVAEYFGVSVDYLVRGEDHPTSDRLLSYAETRLLDDYRHLDPSRKSLVEEYVRLMRGHEEYIKTDILHPEEKIGG